MKISADDLFPYNFDNVLRDILEHKHTYYVFKGGRGSCKSSFVSIAIILLMTRKENRDKGDTENIMSVERCRDNRRRGMSRPYTSIGQHTAEN